MSLHEKEFGSLKGQPEPHFQGNNEHKRLFLGSNRGVKNGKIGFCPPGTHGEPKVGAKFIRTERGMKDGMLMGKEQLIEVFEKEGSVYFRE